MHDVSIVVALSATAEEVIIFQMIDEDYQGRDYLCPVSHVQTDMKSNQTNLKDK